MPQNAGGVRSGGRGRTVLLQEVHGDGQHAPHDVRQASPELRQGRLQGVPRLGHADDARRADDVGAVVEVVDAARVHDLLPVDLGARHRAHHRPGLPAA